MFLYDVAPTGVRPCGVQDWEWPENSNDSPAHKIDTAVDSDQCTCVHVADHAVVFDGQIAVRLVSSGLAIARH